uniref:Uncharacterized protein n=1 Tax=Oryza barthii TaxID=65489 RepID=A0A0D3HGF0_9ORYZ
MSKAQAGQAGSLTSAVSGDVDRRRATAVRVAVGTAVGIECVRVGRALHWPQSRPAAAVGWLHRSPSEETQYDRELRDSYPARRIPDSQLDLAFRES